MSLNDSEISSETTMSETLPETLSTSSETSLNNIDSEILEVSSDDIEKKLASAIADGVFLNRFHNMKELKSKLAVNSLKSCF